jgi:hypothetical protein
MSFSVLLEKTRRKAGRIAEVGFVDLRKRC